MSYTVNEVFYSVQGEGVRAGTANVFVRFAGCNLACNGDEDGETYRPVCDTEFTSGRKMTAQEIVGEARRVGGRCRSVILTGGEPLLQVDWELVEALREEFSVLAVETNGTIPIDRDLFDYVVLSPKVADHALKLRRCDELRVIRAFGQAIPKCRVEARHLVISPAFEPGRTRENIDWCVQLVKDNPEWRLSIQWHKLIGAR